MDIDEAKRNIRILNLAQEAGYNPKQAGAGEFKIRCPNPDHADSDASCYIDDKNNLFFCHGCSSGGSVVDFVMMANQLDVKDALEMLGVEHSKKEKTNKTSKPIVPVAPAQECSEKKKRNYRVNDPEFKTKEYIYRTENGNPVYKAVRYDYPDGTKSFQMVSRRDDGTAVMSMKGVIRVPYRLNEIQDHQKIYIVEGEKCADALASAGLPSTTTCNGSNGWIKEYSRYFEDKDLVIIPDNDDAGRKFAETIASDCSDIARSIKIVDMFTDRDSKWDVADEIELIGDNGNIVDLIETYERLTKKIVKGIHIDINTAGELTEKLRDRYQEWQDGGIDLIRIFPVLLGHNIRPLVGGDMLVISSGTACGKTALAQSIATEYNEHPVLWFSIELSRTRMHERNLVRANRMTAQEIEEHLLNGCSIDTSAIEHIHIIDEARLDLDYIDKVLSVFPLMAGEPPRLVVVDYIQLMIGTKGIHNPFEVITSNAVGLKVLAKKYNVVMCVISQIGRKDEANLLSSKGSGAIEESATVLLGLNKVDDFDDIRRIGIYKNTNGEDGIDKEIGYEGKYFMFESTASARRLHSMMHHEAIEDEIDSEEGLIEGGIDGSCPF